MSDLDARSATTVAPPFAAEWADWHADHERRRADPHGFLAITSIRWLGDAPERFPDVPGAWSTGAAGPVVELAADETLEIDGAPVTGTHRFGPLAERSGILASWTRDGTRSVVEIARRGGNDIIRPRHPDAPILASYPGTDAFAPDECFVVEGRFVPFEEPRNVTVGSVVDGLQHVYAAPGAIEFDLDGPQRLLAFNGHGDGLLALFTDATSGVTTYAANRSVAVEAPDAAGRVVIDFNRAVNLPCAYTPYATCPLPPAENRLGIAIEAGEKKPADTSAAG